MIAVSMRLTGRSTPGTAAHGARSAAEDPGEEVSWLGEERLTGAGKKVQRDRVAVSRASGTRSSVKERIETRPPSCRCQLPGLKKERRTSQTTKTGSALETDASSAANMRIHRVSR